LLLNLTPTGLFTTLGNLFLQWKCHTAAAWDLADFRVYRHHYGYQHFPSLLCSEEAASVTDTAYRWRSWIPFPAALSSKQENEMKANRKQ